MKNLNNSYRTFDAVKFADNLTTRRKNADISKIPNQFINGIRPKKLTQSVIASMLNITRTAYGSYEQIKCLDSQNNVFVLRNEPSLETICKLAEIFCISTDELLMGTKGKNCLIIPKNEPIPTTFPGRLKYARSLAVSNQSQQPPVQLVVWY